MPNKIFSSENRISDPILENAIGSLSERLRELIGDRSIRLYAKEVGVSEGTVRGYLRGTPPKLLELVKIAKLDGVSLEWLATGEGPKHAVNPAIQQVSIESEDFCEEYALIDGYHTQVSTGHGAAWDEQPVQRRLAFRSKWLRFRDLQPESLKVLFAKGDSMEPTIHSGDSILVDTSVHQLTDGSIFVLSLGGDLYAKRLQKRFDGGIEIISDNKEYTNQVVPAAELEQLHIIGKVVWIGKDVK